jgi:hypothetical protein
VVVAVPPRLIEAPGPAVVDLREPGEPAEPRAVEVEPRAVKVEPGTMEVEPRAVEVNAAVVALLERSREGLRAAALDLDARSRWAGAYLAALRAATAVLAVRGRPGPARSRPRSVWQVLPRLAPELGEWAVFLGALQRLPEGAARRSDPRAADDLLRDAEQFLHAVTRALSLPWRPVLPEVVPASR